MAALACFRVWASQGPASQSSRRPRVTVPAPPNREQCHAQTAFCRRRSLPISHASAIAPKKDVLRASSTLCRESFSPTSCRSLQLSRSLTLLQPHSHRINTRRLVLEQIPVHSSLPNTPVLRPQPPSPCHSFAHFFPSHCWRAMPWLRLSPTATPSTPLARTIQPSEPHTLKYSTRPRKQSSTLASGTPPPAAI